MVIPLAVGVGAGLVGGGIAGSLMGGGKVKPIDITAQLQQLQSNYQKNREINSNLPTALNPLTDTYKADLANAINGQKTDFANNKAEYLGATDTNTKEAQDALRKNLYSNTFNALPDTLQAVREASAAGGGLNTGSYQKAVNDVGRTTAQTIAQGEGQLQAQGAQMKQGAQENAFNAFNNLTSKLSDQQINGLTKVMDTGREDLIRQYTTSMGLNDQETQGILDLLNFQQSGNMANDNAEAANKQSLYNALIGGGATLMGRGGK